MTSSRFQKTYGAVNSDGYVGNTKVKPLSVVEIKTLTVDFYSTDVDGVAVDTTATIKVEGSLGSIKWTEVSPITLSTMDAYGGPGRYDVSKYSDVRLSVVGWELPTVVDVIGDIVSATTGNGNVTSAQGADGYIAFFTGANTIAGDNDLSYNRATGDLTLGGSGRHLIGNGTAAKPAIAFASDDDGSGAGFYRLSAAALGVSHNANLVMSWSQNYINCAKYLYNSASPLALGGAFTTGHGLGTGDVGVAGALEVDGVFYADAAIVASSNVSVDGYVAVKSSASEPPNEPGESKLWTTNDDFTSLMVTDGYAGASVTHYLSPNYAEMYMITPAAVTGGTDTYTKAGGVTGAGIVHGNFLVGSGNTVVWTGQYTVDVKVTGHLSMTTSGSTEIVTLAIAVNGVVQTKTEIDRKIGTGSDLGAASCGGIVTLSTNDEVSLYVKVDSGSSVTINKLNMLVRPA